MLKGILELGMKLMSLLYKFEFCDFKLAKEEDARNHFRKFSFSFVSCFLPSLLHEPLCKLLKNCANTENLFTGFEMLTCTSI